MKEFKPTNSNYRLSIGTKVELYNGTTGIIEATDNYYFKLKGRGYFHRMDVKMYDGGYDL